MQKNIISIMAVIILASQLNPANSQTIDFIESTRFANPPVSAFYAVTNASGEVHAERLGYNPSFDFNGQTVLEIKTFSSAGVQEEEKGAAYLQFNDESIILLGSTFTDKTLGTVTLPFVPPIIFPRNVAAGTKVEGKVDASVKLGPIPVKVTITVTYEFTGLETVVLDTGTFENTLRLRTIRAVSLSGIPLVSQDRTEWHHPAASMVKFADNDFGSVGVLTALEPPLPPVTPVEHWSLY